VQRSNYARSVESGRSVDVSTAGLDLGIDFDDFTPRSLAYSTDGVSNPVPPSTASDSRRVRAEGDPQRGAGDPNKAAKRKRPLAHRVADGANADVV
jgi:hypothetical protein